MCKLVCRSKGIIALIFLQDGNPTLGDCEVIISLSTLLTVAALNDLGSFIENCDESPGIYYENKGVAVLYNIAWRTVLYVNLNKIDNATMVLR